MGLSQKEKEELVFNKNFLISAFRGFDKNGDGTVSLNEFKEVMKRSGKITDAHINEMMKKGDLDGDGKLTFDEFEKAMQAV